MRKLDSLGILESLDLVLDKVEAISWKQRVFLDGAVGKILAEDVVAKRDLPLFDNSAMDGFAFKQGSPKKLKIKKTIFAGDVVEPCLEEGECYKIMTGAFVPSDADTVIPFEKCKFDEEFVEIDEVKEGANLRKRGEEVKEGQVLIKKGTKITFAEVAMLAAQGITNVEVYRDLRICFVVSGSELKESFEEAGEFEAYNANYALKALLRERGFNVDYYGILPDNFEKTKGFFEKYLNYDVIITTGGISQGEADFVIDALNELNFEKYIHGILVKPGRATLAGKLGDTLILGMPGNPLSAIVQMLSFGVPILEKLRGNRNFYHKFVEIENRKSFKVNPGKDHTILGEIKKDGFYVIDNYKYGSGMITPLLKANGIAIVEKGKKVVEENEKIKAFFI